MHLPAISITIINGTFKGTENLNKLCTEFHLFKSKHTLYVSTSLRNFWNIEPGEKLVSFTNKLHTLFSY